MRKHSQMVTSRPQQKNTKGKTARRPRMPVRFARGEHDHFATRESIRRHYSDAGKRSHWGFGPLSRFLTARIGKPWSEVAADLESRLSSVAPGVRLTCDDALYRLVQRPGGHAVDAAFFVDDSGILQRAPQRSPGIEPPAITESPELGKFEQKTIGDTVRLIKLKGVWYKVVLAPLPAPPIDTTRETTTELTDWAPRDVILGAPAADFKTLEGLTAVFLRTWGGKFYAVSKRQIGKRELARHGLRNAA